mmetsp:Transcript_63864/g.133033  ORF Transcript_63864/g.133033 Transcript_63864/m.133033 type:complete len:102 (-) Transcript_63864:1438-1743(-)
MREIVNYYPHLFPARIRQYVRTTVPSVSEERRCRTCVLMKGARKYLKSKRMKVKQAQQQTRRDEEKRTTLDRRRLRRAAAAQPLLALGVDAVLPRVQLVAL